ncbi:heavy metal translocating P-type ATPase [Terricaulis sp.]|uniref:heavy metal translocating P-type ATPase n=1 Tax=Terricaulis sp. TaxID=2768686 RepID=UPI003783637B
MDSATLSPAGCPSGLSPPTETAAPRADIAAFVRHDAAGDDTLELMVAGAKCAGCIRKIEGGLLALPGVQEARLNLSTQRLRVAWRPGALAPQRIVETLTRLGYAANVFDPEQAQRNVDEEGRRLLRYLAVAGFAAMNIMMFSLPIWFGDDMGPGTRTLLHWISALIAIPAALYAAQPFFRSAYSALKARRANMDVPISLAVFLTLGMSIAETLQQGGHAYFDGITMLLFFLLIGRYLDHQLRERARTAAKELLALQSVAASRIGADGHVVAVPARDIAIGDRLMLAAGDRAIVDGVIEQGVSELDRSMLTGETMPVPARAGDAIQAGVINLTRQITVRATARAEDSAIAELARLIETGEQGRGKFVRLADRAAALYVPVVHSLAALTFTGWLLVPMLLRALGYEAPHIGVREALINAVAVLIITCPCALGLAVPAVQVVATGRLFKRGVLVKSGDALERLAKVDVVVFDKTGTLTLGKPRLVSAIAPETLQAAASLARVSRHPLSRAVVEAAGPGVAADGAVEHPGEGVEATVDGKRVRLGRRSFAAADAAEANDGAPELWFKLGDEAPVRFMFQDALRTDAASTIAVLRRRGYEVELLSGDRPAAVEAAARAVGIENWQAQVTPAEKTARIRALREQGRRPFMVGDGLNDAAALAAAYASASPGTAIEASQAAADIVVQGGNLGAVIEAIDVARAAQARALENLRFSAVYNLVAAPTAALGFLTPLIAAAAMSASSLIVTANALRLQLMRGA